MRFSGIAAASLVAPLVAAHGGVPGAPKIFGLGPNPIAKLKSRNVFHGHAEVARPQGPQLNARQGGVDGQCGPVANGASCDAGFCCSPSGWCGVGNDYCAAPDCLFQYGPGCDANQVPGGSDTSTVARPKLGNVDYGGEGVYACKVPGTVAITYDDGPYIYTDGILDQFAAYNAKATFFVTGINNGKGAIDNAATAWPAVIRRMYAEEHQVASHTWSHQDLSAITSQQRKDQMVHNEMAIRNIIGKFPTYMRPPYSSCTAASGCQADMATLGYVVSYFDLDTDDYDNTTPELIQNAKNNFANPLQPSNPATADFLVIAHDIHQQTAQNLTGYMLDLLTAKGYRAVTMGECMGEPVANWYRDSAGSLGTSTSATVIATSATAIATSATVSSAAPTSTPTGPTSPDGSCGGTAGYSCIGFELGSCCSQYGYCGAEEGYCGTGCNPLFGTCGTSVSASPSVASSAAVSQSSTVAPSSTVVSSLASSVVSSSSSVASSSSSPAALSTTPRSSTSSISAVRSSTITTTTRSATSTVGATRTSTATPKPTQTVSTNGSCGGTKKMTCKGSGKNQCCRWDGKCSNDIWGCGVGCQKQYGVCWW